MADPIVNGKNMRLAAVRSRDTKPEWLLRRALWRRGLRYRLQRADLPGRPDVVFPRQRVAVFVDGDFWHGRNWETLQPRLSSEAWVRKIQRTIERDAMQGAALAEAGWTVLRFWETDLKRDIGAAVDRVLVALERAGQASQRERTSCSEAPSPAGCGGAVRDGCRTGSASTVPSSMP